MIDADIDRTFVGAELHYEAVAPHLDEMDWTSKFETVKLRTVSRIDSRPAAGVAAGGLEQYRGALNHL